MVSDNTVHKAFRIHKTLIDFKQNPLIREIFYFYYLSQLYIGFNLDQSPHNHEWISTCK